METSKQTGSKNNRLVNAVEESQPLKNKEHNQQSKYIEGRRLIDNVFDKEEPVRQGRGGLKPQETKQDSNEEEEQLIKNVRITKGVVRSEGSISSNRFSLSCRYV